LRQVTGTIQCARAQVEEEFDDLLENTRSSVRSNARGKVDYQKRVKFRHVVTGASLVWKVCAIKEAVCLRY